MKKLLLALCLSVFHLYGLAVTKTSNLTGDWSNPLVWSPTGVPAANDDVIINGVFQITVSTNVSCKSIRIAGANAQLIVAQSGNLNVAQAINLVVGNTAESNTFNVYGSVICGGELLLDYRFNTGASGLNTVNLGDATRAGTLSVGADLRFYSSTIASTALRNAFQFNQGLLEVSGNIAFTSNLSTSKVSYFNINDNTTVDNKAKSISLKGTMIGLSGTNYVLNDANENAPYTFIYSGSTPQTLIQSNITYQNLTISNAEGVSLSAHMASSQLLKKLTISSGATLNMGAFNLNGVNRYPGQMQMDANAVLSMTKPDNFPSQKSAGSYVLICASTAVIDYNIDADDDVMKSDFNYPIIRLRGLGAKRIANDVDNVKMSVNEIQLKQGGLVFKSGSNLIMSNALNKLVDVGADTYVEIEKSFSSFNANFKIHPTSTFYYLERNKDQQIYSFKNPNGQVEPYGNLFFERKKGNGAYKRFIAPNEVVKIRGKLNTIEKGEITINQGAILEFSSDADYTGYLGEVDSDTEFKFVGNPAGKAVVRKYIQLSKANYRDFTSPVKGTTLKSFQNAGLRMTGFPGSNYPTFSFNNAYRYDQAISGNFNQGFISAANINEPIATISGGKIVSSGWRIYSGSNAGTTFTLSDTGIFNVGDVIFKLGFTAGGGNRNTDDGWNFIGNPYPCPIAWNKIVNDPSNLLKFTTQSIRPSVYIFRPLDTGFPNDPEDSYSFYNPITGIVSHLFETKVIPANQGFWVKTYSLLSNNTSYDLVIKESHKFDQAQTSFFKADSLDFNQFKMELALSQGNFTDKIWAHPFPGATAGNDFMFDVERFGEEFVRPTIAFSDSGQAMNVWVNAFSDLDKETTLPILIYTPTADTCRLSISNIKNLIERYGCLNLFDTQSGSSFALSNDTNLVFLSSAGYKGIRFIVKFSRNLEKDINYQDATCFDFNDGKLNINMQGYNANIHFDLYRNGSLFTQIEGVSEPTGMINLDLPQGSYRLENREGLISCSSNSLDFNIASYPEVKSIFELPAIWEVNEFIPISNKSLGATSFDWNFSDGFSTFAAVPLYFFEESGNYTVSLEAKNAYNCSGGVQSKEIAIRNSTGMSDQTPKDVVISSNTGWLNVVWPQNTSGKLDLIDLSGRLISSTNLQDSREINLKLDHEQQVFILRFTGTNEHWHKKLMP